MFDKFGFAVGYLKLVIYKIYYGKRLVFSWKIRFMPSSKIRIGKAGKIYLGNNFRSRYNLLLKVGDHAEINKDDNVFINDSNKILVLGHESGSIYNEILPKKSKEHFLFRGYVSTEQLEVLYKNAYVFLYPSLNEGFGYPL